MRGLVRVERVAQEAQARAANANANTRRARFYRTDGRRAPDHNADAVAPVAAQIDPDVWFGRRKGKDPADKECRDGLRSDPYGSRPKEYTDINGKVRKVYHRGMGADDIPFRPMATIEESLPGGKKRRKKKRGKGEAPEKNAAGETSGGPGVAGVFATKDNLVNGGHGAAAPPSSSFMSGVAPVQLTAEDIQRVTNKTADKRGRPGAPRLP